MSGFRVKVEGGNTVTSTTTVAELHTLRQESGLSELLPKVESSIRKLRSLTSQLDSSLTTLNLRIRVGKMATELERTRRRAIELLITHPGLKCGSPK